MPTWCKVWVGDLDVYGTPEEYPIVATTYRLTEHWHTGMMSRNVPLAFGDPA